MGVGQIGCFKMSSLQPSSSSASPLSSALVVPQVLVGGRFQMKHRIGQGAFGDIFLAVDSVDGEDIALKRESLMTRPPQLHSEYKLYGNIQGGIGVPRVLWFGPENGYNWLAMDLLGPSIEDLFNLCSRSFTMKTLLMLADGMLNRVEYLHSKQYIHRDIKPDNFVMGIGPTRDTVYLIDLGLARRFCDSRTGQHIPQRDNKPLSGTVRYASIFTHLGLEQSRRDDMEQLAYVLIYLIKGSLPWQGIKADTKKQKYDKIKDIKLSIAVLTLCQGCPEEFSKFLNYCRQLKFEETPDYNFIRHMFRTLLHRLNHQFDYDFDWKNRKQCQPSQARLSCSSTALAQREPQQQ